MLARLPQAPATDCTTQQAFYKLRRALRPYVGGQEIRPASRLAELLPTADPRPAATAMQAALGIRLELVGRPAWATAMGAALLVLAGPLCFAGWYLGASLLCLGVLWLDASRRLGRTVRDTTLRELARHMASRYYRQSRRHPDTVNLREVKTRLDALFLDNWGIEAAQLVPGAVL